MLKGQHHLGFLIFQERSQRFVKQRLRQLVEPTVALHQFLVFFRNPHYQHIPLCQSVQRPLHVAVAQACQRHFQRLTLFS